MIIAQNNNDNLAHSDTHRVSPDFEHFAHERVDVLPAGIEALARLKEKQDGRESKTEKCVLKTMYLNSFLHLHAVWLKRNTVKLRLDPTLDVILNFTNITKMTSCFL